MISSTGYRKLDLKKIDPLCPGLLTYLRILTVGKSLSFKLNLINREPNERVKSDGEGWFDNFMLI